MLLVNQGFSQRWSRYKYEFYYGIGATNFMGDVGARNTNAITPITEFVYVDFWNTIGFTTNAGLRYHFKDRQYVRANLFLGQLYANEPRNDDKSWGRSIKFNSFYTELAVKYEFMIIKESKRTTIYRKLGESRFKNFSLPTYLFIGVGGTFNTGKLTAARDLSVVTLNYTNFAPVIPFGIGFKYRINKLTYINLEAEWHFTLSDGIDNFSKDTYLEVGVGDVGDWYDQYQTITLNIVYKLRQNQNGLPRFKRR